MFKKLFITLVIPAVIIVCGFFVLLEENMNKSIQLNTAELVTIKSGVSLSSFSQELVNKGWVNNRFWLRSFGKIYPEKSQIKSGTYKLEPQITLQELLTQITQGKEHQFTLTFIEGTTLKEWLLLLDQQPNLTHQLSGKSGQEVAELLDIDTKNPEGWFFPETYAYTKGTSDLTLLQRAHKKMHKHLNELWENRLKPLPYQNKYEALIMASIIEKETSVVDEMPIISSVFVNRLNKGMRLQTDPTVIYGLGDRYAGDIKRQHLREKTAYNTYRIDGLPPTPIASPGLKALEAALAPSTTEYLYFVSMGNGTHIFTTNLNDHNKAVRKYQLGL